MKFKNEIRERMKQLEDGILTELKTKANALDVKDQLNDKISNETMKKTVSKLASLSEFE